MKTILLMTLLIYLILKSVSIFANSLPLKHAVGLIITPNGLNKMGSSIPNLTENMGVDPNGFKLESYNLRLNKQHTSDFFDDPKMKEIVDLSIDGLSKYFEGLEVKSHDVRVDINQINAKANIENITAKFVFTDSASISNESAFFDVELKMVLNNIEIRIDEIRANDINNKFLGEFGVDHFRLWPSSSSRKLKLSMPLRVWREESGMRVQALGMSTNLKDIGVSIAHQYPLVLPEVAIRINDREYPLKLDEVDRLVSEKVGGLIPQVKEWIEENSDGYLSEIVEKKVNSFLRNGFEIISEIEVPSTDPDKITAPLLWQANAEEGDYTFSDRGLFLDHVGKVIDPEREDFLEPRDLKYYAHGKLEVSDKTSLYDLSLFFNQGFINDFIQVAFERGEFKQIEYDKEKIELLESPFVRVENGRIKVDLHFKYWVRGLQKIFTKGPIEINIQAFIGFTSGDKGVGLFVEEVDFNSFKVNKNQFRWPFRKLSSKKAKKKLMGMKDMLEGFVLTESLPIPADFYGFKLRAVDSSVDPNGYALIHTEVLK